MILFLLPVFIRITIAIYPKQRFPGLKTVKQKNSLEQMKRAANAARFIYYSPSDSPNSPFGIYFYADDLNRRHIFDFRQTILPFLNI